MDDFSRMTKDAFDFSKDADLFKTRLWKKLKESMAEPGVQQLDDDDLAWVNAAGTLHPERKEQLTE